MSTVQGVRHCPSRVRAAALIGAVAAVAVASGCGSSDSSTSSASSSASKPAAASTAISTGKKGALDEITDVTKLCGTKNLTIGYADSFASVNGWRKISLANLKDEASKCPNIKIVSTDGGGKLQKAISDINGLVSQGVDGLIVLPDFGKSEVPAMRKAMKAGVPVVAFNYPGLGGTFGTDYVDSIYTDEVGDAATRTKWLAKVLKKQGNLIDLGGTPGNSLSTSVYSGVADTLKQFPTMKLLVDRPVDTNFSAADEQKAVAGLLAKYPKIDGVQNECGTCAPGGIRAFQAAKRPLVPWTSDDNNELACLYKKLKPANPDFELFTTAARNTLIRPALHKVLAKVNGVGLDEPSVYNMPAVEDSTDPSKQPVCDPSAPQGAIFSSTLSHQQAIDATR